MNDGTLFLPSGPSPYPLPQQSGRGTDRQRARGNVGGRRDVPIFDDGRKKKGGSRTAPTGRPLARFVAGDGRVRVLGTLVLGTILATLSARPCLAVCTKSGTLSPNTSTAIVGSNDIVGIEGRHYLLIQNTGTTNAMNVAIGSNNAATTSDLYLGPGASWVITAQGLKMVPGGDVAIISVSGTNYSFCDW